MDKTTIMQRLMATFVEELDEHVRTLNQELLALEKHPPAEEWAERFKALFRAAHSLKGAARSVNVDLIEAACHRLEELLTRVQAGQAALDAELVALIFAVADALEEAGMRLREQHDLGDAPLAGLLPRLDAALRGDASRPRPAPHPSMPSPPQASEPAAEPTVASVRVAAEKLDALLASVGELRIAQRRIETRSADVAALREFLAAWQTQWQRIERLTLRRQAPLSWPRRAVAILGQAGENLRQLDRALGTLARGMAGDLRLFDAVAEPLEREVRRVRMIPFMEACAGLDRMVRDLAQATDKDVNLRIEGGPVELDRSILEGVKDPLRHLVRNAVDHGLETPSERGKAGKPRQGTITVSAAPRGAQVEVKVSDDGRGLDLEAIRAHAVRKKIDPPADARELARLVFLPGFSTAGIVTDISGRGVGLDVVKNRIEQLHGTVELDFAPGRGASFTLMLPLTLTTLRAVLVRAAGRACAFAGTNVLRLLRIARADIRGVAGRPTLMFDGVPLPVASLAGLLDPACASEPPAENMPVLIIAAATTRMALVVDELLAEQEILIKNLGPRIRHTPLVIGATLLPSGEAALVLSAANVIRHAMRQSAAWPARASAKQHENRRKRLLIVEDSMTTRALMKSILEAAGYDVLSAVDGRSAWRMLNETPVDLVVSDIDMPNMDGFELTAAIRAAKNLAALPVVLVTARENDADKARGIEVGADAYLVKSAFDQRNLLETIGQMI